MKANSAKRRRTTRTSALEQQQFEFKSHGGARRGAGRKPKHSAAGASHRKRASTPARFPLLVTQRLCADLPSLRHVTEFDVLTAIFAEVGEREGFRLVHFSVQSNHLHYMCEARDTRCLASGMRCLGVMIARRLNRLWKRKGQVLADRYHARALATPNEVRQALAYVLNNARKHGIHGAGPDPFSSGPWFDGWDVDATAKVKSARDAPRLHASPLPTATAETWLLRVGWRLRDRIGVRETPGGRAARHANAKEEQRLVDMIQRRLAAAARDTAKRPAHDGNRRE